MTEPTPIPSPNVTTPPAIPAAPACQIIGLSHRYGPHIAVNNVNFTIARKSIHGFVGPNGAGKTTTLKVIATLLKPQTGSVKIYGSDIATQYKEVRKRIGYMQDHFSMYRQMTVFEYLDFFGAAYGLSVQARNQTISDVLTLTDMEGRKDSQIKGLSRGMQQRVSLARALVHDPDLLLLDEPASGLDPRARIELMEILEELRNIGKTVFISSHILSELATLCDHVTIVDKGAVKYTGTMKGLGAADTQETAYVIELKENLPAAEEALQNLEGIKDVAQRVETPGYRISFLDDQLRINDVLQAVLATGAEIISFNEDRKHLNQAFMDLTEPGVRT